MRILTLHVKAKYWYKVKNREKFFEFRLKNSYWEKRLEGKHFDEIHYFLGYPKKGNKDKLLRFQWNGHDESIINHPEFGKKEVLVYAINLSKIIYDKDGD